MVKRAQRKTFWRIVISALAVIAGALMIELNVIGVERFASLYSHGSGGIELVIGILLLVFGARKLSRMFWN